MPRYGDVYAAVERAPAPVPEIAFLGRVTPYKGLGVAIEALALLRDGAHPDARLVVIGPEDPDYGAKMRGLAERLGVAGAVSWEGQRTPEQSAAILARAHALIVPSVWDEPFPLVTIEGALARVPLVASDVGGIGEGMHDEEHALLFDRGDAGGAAAALGRVLAESGRDRRARRARPGPRRGVPHRSVSRRAGTLRARRPRGARGRPTAEASYRGVIAEGGASRGAPAGVRVDTIRCHRSSGASRAPRAAALSSRVWRATIGVVS